MGKPMKNRILTIALALSLIAVAFAVLPTSTTAAVTYTGGVTTTDSEHDAKTVFVENEDIYFDVELMWRGIHVADDIWVRIYNTYTSNWGSSLMDVTNDPAVGWFNSSQVAPPRSLSINLGGGEPDMVVCEVVAYVWNNYTNWEEFAREPITVLKERLTLSPDLDIYYPGQSVDITLVTMRTDDFYVQIVNETEVRKVNWTSQETGDDHYWNTVWTIAATFEDGYYELRVRDEDTHAVWYWTWFYVLKYELEVLVDKNFVLPGDTSHMTYQITDVATGTPYYGPTIEYQAQYYNSSGNMTNVSGTLPSGAGAYDYVVPTDIALWSNIGLSFWANETGRSAEDFERLYISVIEADVWTDWYTYSPSEPVVVMLYASASADEGSEALGGADIDVSVSRNDTAIPAYGATDLVTTQYGWASYGFNLIDNAEPGVYLVEATVSKLGMSVTVMDTFEVDEGAWIMVEFDRDDYMGGDTAVLSFTAVMNNLETSAAFSYTVYTSFGILATGNSSGEDASVLIPIDYYGWIGVDAGTYLEGIPYADHDDAYVYYASVELVAEADEYRPGDTIVWNWNILAGQHTGTLDYWIWDNDDILVGSGSPAFAATGTIEYDVPEDGASTSYMATLRMTTVDGGYLQSSYSVDLVAEYELVIWVEKSRYASGEFKPGDTVTIRYEILSHLGGEPAMYWLWFSVEDEPADFNVIVSEPEGSFEYALPADASSGEYWVEAEAYDVVTGAYLDYDEASFLVNNQLSVWDRSVGGMAMSDFLILVLIIVMIIVLIVMPFVKGRQPKAAAPAQEEPPPPAEPPKP